MRKLLLATNNKGKILEYQALLKGIPYRMVMLSDCAITTEVDESGSTYKENAALKATAFARESGPPSDRCYGRPTGSFPGPLSTAGASRG